MNTTEFLIIGICTGALCSCATMNDGGSYTNSTYDYNNETVYYSQNYDSSTDSGLNYNDSSFRSEVAVPESYHVGSYHSPQSAKNVDKQWVTSQNPQGYTIEIANDEKPSVVAKKLYQVPKTERMAEIKYQSNGKVYYKGVYGSYSSPAEAEKALNALPPEVKQGAGVKPWGNVQSNVGE